MIHGGNRPSILIAGSTTFENSSEVVDKVLAEWGSTASYRTRVDHLRQGTGSILGGTGIKPFKTIVSDGVANIIMSTPNRDLVLGGTVRSLRLLRSTLLAAPKRP